MTRPDARDRLVEVAVQRLHERGVTVALDGIALEEVIAESGVSRATAYRRWPNRKEFLREVLIRAVRSVRLEPETPQNLSDIRAMVESRRDTLDTEDGRRTVVVEGLRMATEADYRRLAGSREWRDYLALRATCDGLPDDELRATLAAELRAAEQASLHQRAAVYSRIPEMLGYRLVTPLDGEAGLRVMAETMGAVMTGLVLAAAPGTELTTFRARAFGSTADAEWTTASYALTAALISYLEPAPSTSWDVDRVIAELSPEAIARHLDSPSS